MMRRAIVGLLLVIPAAIAAQEGTYAWTRVTYLSGSSVYVDAGTRDGIKEGGRMEVVRNGAVVAELAVAFVSSTRASCTVSRSSSDPVIGDSVRFVAVRAATTVAGGVGAAGAPGAAARQGLFGQRGALRGRLGVRYLVIAPGSGGGNSLTQPAFDVRLDGQHLGGSPIGLVVDVRAQRTAYGSSVAGSVAPAATNVTRAYQAALIWNSPGSPARVTVGRQFATALSTIGMFDGAAYDVDGDRWSGGVLTGMQPEPLGMGLAGDIRQYGAYVQIHNRPASNPLWSFTAGGVGAYDRGEIDREFLYLRATYTGRHISLFAAQELDVNRGWRVAAEGSSTTPTSTFAIVNVSVTDWFGLNGGVDNRRNVRLYRDYINPESSFDDTFREGVWGGASVTAFGRLRLASDVRTSTGGTAGTAQSLTHSVSLSRLTPLQLGLRARATTFTGLTTSGELQSASVELTPFGAFRVEFTAGRRHSATPGDASAQTQLSWTSIDADVGIGRSVYLMLSTSRESGTLDHNIQSYMALSYRF
jgi:hypothetical protein